MVVARRVLDALGAPITVAGEPILIAGSIGLATFPADGTTAEALLEGADAAMYRAKESSGNSWELFSGQMATDAPRARAPRRRAPQRDPAR